MPDAHRVAGHFAAPGFVATDHRFIVPLDHAAPDDDATIEVFARELRAPEAEATQRPMLLFLQGGPGSPSPRPTALGGWLGRALRDFRVLLLDQRGTGLSTPATAQTLAHLQPEEQAAYLQHFRADAIVADAEVARRALIGDAPWSVLGQSFGGYCSLTYLSFAPEGLREVFLTGGLGNVHARAEDVYRATFPRLAARNRAYLKRYPEDEAAWTELAELVRTQDVRLPDGTRLTVEQLQFLGMHLGRDDGFEALHHRILGAVVEVGGSARVSDTFLYEVFSGAGIHTNPIFALLHEPLYAQGEASAWAAARVLSETPGFAYVPGQPFRFLGEMILPWMFDQYPSLRPLKEAAELLARKSDWPALYDPARLADNRVPVAAAVYADDMFVDADLSLAMARAIPNVRVWLTNEYQHSGLRVAGEAILERLMGMTRGSL